MAKEPDSPEIRFPLRRSQVPEPAPAPRPAPKSKPEAKSEPKPERKPIAWRPRRVETEPEPQWFETLAPLELTHGTPPPRQRPQRAAAVPPPPPPPPPPPVAPLDLTQPLPEGSYTTNLPVLYRPSMWRWVSRGIGAFIVLFILAVGWLAITAPLSKSLEPPAPPQITLFSADGKPIAQRGAVIGKPVNAEELPVHVRNAFIAIEDRRFYSHWGIDPRGIARALVHNLGGGEGYSQGGSTITQQLAKNAFLDSSKNIGRKFQEVLIAFWLEARLTKNEILSRYLSNVYFGDNVYGLRAAANHYFSCDPDELTVSQASMLAGLVQAPSRLAPTGNLKGARARQKLVIGAMVSAGLLDKDEAAKVKPAVLKPDRTKPLPNGGYFADWVLPQARDQAGAISAEQTVQTTLETRAQSAAERAARNASLGGAQIAIVAMHPDGRVVAMVGGTKYGDTPFNRATQARRQPGSTFKLFVYLAALRSGMSLDDMVDDTPVSFGGWSPKNSHDSYEGRITLRRAFAKSSNVVAARLTKKLGVSAVTRAARDLGISTPIGDDASIALGTSTTSLLELTAAYASVAQGAYPIRPRGLANEEEQGWISRALGTQTMYRSSQLEDLRSLLRGVVENGTGRSAALAAPAFGKTGTTQDNRDALFVGYAGEGDDAIVAGVWVGNDDNSPNARLSGGGLPARVWRDFMTRALDIRAPAPPPEPLENEIDEDGFGIGNLLEGLRTLTEPGEVETEVELPGPSREPREDRGREPPVVTIVRPGAEPTRRTPPAPPPRGPDDE